MTQSTFDTALCTGLATAVVLVTAACASPKPYWQRGGIYTESGEVRVQAPVSGGCRISNFQHVVKVNAVRDGAVVATDKYTPGWGFVFNIGSRPFQLTAIVDGHSVTMTVVPKNTGGTATAVNLVVPAVGCSPAASSEVIYPSP